MHRRVMREQSSAKINSLHNSIHPREREINPLKMVCGCPCGRVLGENGHTDMQSSPYGIALVNVQLHILGDPQRAELE